MFWIVILRIHLAVSLTVVNYTMFIIGFHRLSSTCSFTGQKDIKSTITTMIIFKILLQTFVMVLVVIIAGKVAAVALYAIYTLYYYN